MLKEDRKRGVQMRKKIIEPAAPAEIFSYCVGCSWSDVDPRCKDTECVSVYVEGTQIRHGTMEMAEKFRQKADEQTGRKMSIYKLVAVD
jgi:hypothetical protein